MQFRQTLKNTTNQTALTGVWVWGLTLDKKAEKGSALSLANAYAIRVSASIAEQPVKNWTKMANAHMAVPPVFPPALRKICAAGRPVGVLRMPSKSVKQKHMQTVKSQPNVPDTSTAVLMATGPRTAASCVSSDMLRYGCERLREVLQSRWAYCVVPS